MDKYQLRFQEFDRADQKNIGRPTYFDLDKYLSCVEEMISCDEVERAFWMLDNLPAWYRDNVPPQITQIKEQLYKKLFTVVDYAKVKCDVNFRSQDKEAVIRNIFGIPRFKAVLDLVFHINDEFSSPPHIVELAPGSHAIPYALSNAGGVFTYMGEGLNLKESEKAQVELSNWRIKTPQGEDIKKIFVAFELIEHLKSPEDIYHYSLKHECEWDFICLSTPLYTWKGGMGDWWKRDLGHLRCYTPGEFLAFADKYWPGYDWAMTLGDEILLQGTKV